MTSRSKVVWRPTAKLEVRLGEDAPLEQRRITLTGENPVRNAASNVRRRLPPPRVHLGIQVPMTRLDPRFTAQGHARTPTECIQPLPACFTPHALRSTALP